MALPETKSKPTFDLYREKILLYADWKLGKTSLVAAMPFDVLFIAAEKGQSKVDAYVADAPDWATFQQIVADVRNSDKFKMLCIDTVDALWYLYLNHFNKVNNVTWEGDMKWGKGAALLVRGFIQEFISLQHTGKGFFLLAHAKETASGEGESMVRPNLPIDKENRIRDAICGLCDYIIYMRMESMKNKDGMIIQQRTLRTAPSEKYVAGARRKLPDPIPMIEDDPAGSAARLVNAYKKSAITETKKEAKDNGTLAV